MTLHGAKVVQARVNRLGRGGEAIDPVSGRKFFEMRHRFRTKATTSTEGRPNDSGPDVDTSSPPAPTIKQPGADPPVSGLQRDLWLTAAAHTRQRGQRR
jgi:hypothetical protein